MSRSFDECIELARERDKCRSISFAFAKEIESKPYFGEVINEADTWACPYNNDLLIRVRFDKEMSPMYYTSASHYTDGTLALAYGLFSDCILRVLTGNTYCVDKPIDDGVKMITYTVGNFVFVEETVTPQKQEKLHLKPWMKTRETIMLPLSYELTR